MKNVLEFNYNLDTKELVKLEDGSYRFYIDYDVFYLVKIIRPRADIEEILGIIKDYKNSFHYVLLNRFGSIFTNYDGTDYVLIKINGPLHNEVDISDILKNQISVTPGKNSLLVRANWNKLWEEKVDYLEYQVSELATSYKVIKSSFSYYVGLAENAIQYFNMLSPTNAQMVISRRRIKEPNYNVDYFNPLDLVIDYRARDISGYLKSKFFDGDDALEQVDLLVSKDSLTPVEYNLVFCRLLYPSYYFDEMQKIFEWHGNEDAVIKYIDKVDDYEKFLNEVYEKFSKKCSMIKIDWLIKKS